MVTKKRFGQHFLVSESVIKRIVDSTKDKIAGSIIEIGVGRGAITKGLLETGKMLTGIELDRDLIPPLHKQFSLFQNFRLIEQDVLTVDFSSLSNYGPLTIVGNLPYNIGSLILLKMVRERLFLQNAFVMLQKEVGDRLTAESSVSDYSFLSVAVQTYASVKKLFTINPGSFKPPPKVDSVFLELNFNHSNSLPSDTKAYFKLVTVAFSQRRKKVINVLSSQYPAAIINGFFDRYYIDQNARAENIKPEQFVALYNEIKNG